MVCHLRKVLYGFKQVLRAWYEKLSSFLHLLGFRTTRAYSSLLVHISSTFYCYILVYIDDIIIMGNYDHAITQLITTMNDNFSLNDRDKLSYFLGIEVSYLSSCDMFLSQYKYIFDLLHRTKRAEAKSISTPMISDPLLSAHQRDTFFDPHLYRSVVEASQYATLTHLKLSYSVNAKLGSSCIVLPYVIGILLKGFFVILWVP